MGRADIFLNSVAFGLGFSLVFSIVGVLIQTVLSSVAYDSVNLLRVIGGAVIVFFGVFLIASLKYRIPFLQSEHRLKARKFRNRHLSSFVFGVAFAIGWTPCVGAILGSIYTLAAVNPGSGFLLLLTYSMGMGLPFLLVGAFTTKAVGFFQKSHRALRYFNFIGGLFLVILGALMFFNYLGIIAGLFVGVEGAVSVTGQLNFLIVFAAGVLTFVSPCILPLIPGFLSYMASSGTLSQLPTEEGRKK